ncbi:hypothetical protein LguiA_007489 [Lonicera macranthoides]
MDNLRDNDYVFKERPKKIGTLPTWVVNAQENGNFIEAFQSNISKLHIKLEVTLWMKMDSNNISLAATQENELRFNLGLYSPLEFALLYFAPFVLSHISLLDIDHDDRHIILDHHSWSDILAQNVLIKWIEGAVEQEFLNLGHHAIH